MNRPTICGGVTPWKYCVCIVNSSLKSLRVCQVDSNCMSCSQFIPKIVLYQISSDDQSVVVRHITIPPPRPRPTLTYSCVPDTHSSSNSLERGLLIVFYCLLQTNLPSSLYSSALTTSLLMLSSSRHNHSHP